MSVGSSRGRTLSAARRSGRSPQRPSRVPRGRTRALPRIFRGPPRYFPTLSMAWLKSLQGWAGERQQRRDQHRGHQRDHHPTGHVASLSVIPARRPCRCGPHPPLARRQNQHGEGAGKPSEAHRGGFHFSSFRGVDGSMSLLQLQSQADGGQPWKHGEDDRERQYPEDKRHHHPDFLLAGPLHQFPLCRVPDVLQGLGPEDIGERGPAFDGHDHAVNETHERPQICPGRETAAEPRSGAFLPGFQRELW